ncbi:hypothetical protein [Paraburkholderia humisilvae]|uniref:Lipoprotein n=1 Tax=Paraburkholderia humisilvae TaxID=627669 RepID=A0A6J5DKY0_9BURK|nr:hypothetical protein [Paraburkholderia humisilvae]CAB3754738.1 hypothetical protein LMG29542_02440 [Paraburkholderia humisilvae]
MRGKLKLAWLAIAVAMVPLLTACGPDPSNKLRSDAEAAVKRQMGKDVDPAKSFTGIRNARTSVAQQCDDYNGIYYFSMRKACSEELESMKAAAIGPIEDALLAGNVGVGQIAIGALSANAFDDLSEEVRNIVAHPEVATSIVATAVSLNGLSTDQARTYEMLAADVLVAGQGVPADRVRGVQLYDSAWSAGEPLAAAMLANAYVQGRDSVNAYLWSLRCTGTCLAGLIPEAARGALEQTLDPQTITDLRQKAKDPTVLNL